MAIASIVVRRRFTCWPSQEGSAPRTPQRNTYGRRAGQVQRQIQNRHENNTNNGPPQSFEDQLWGRLSGRAVQVPNA
eukprot:15243636-Alexandrium_andersonii.AAC.1